LGLGWLGAIHHDDRAYAERIFLDANANHEAFGFECRLRRQDGAYRWIIDSARPRLSANGEFLGYIGSVIDISDRKAAEEAADEARRFTENLMNTAPVSIYILNCETRRTELSNAYAGEMLGYDPGTWQQMALLLHDLMHPDDVARIDRHFDKLTADLPGRPAEFEYRMRHANGSWRWFLSRDLVYERAANGRLLRILGTAVDITERKRAEEALAETRASLEIALDAAGAASWEYNAQTRQVEWSPQLYSQLGENPDETQASFEAFLAHVHPDDRAGLQALREQERMAEPGSRFSIQLRQTGLGNETRWIERRSYVGADEPGGRRIFGLNIDVTERDKAEEALRESEERFKLAINASRALIYYVNLLEGSKAITFGLENLTGYRDEDSELTSEWWYNLIHPDDLPQHLAILERHLRSGGRYESEYRVRHAGGHWIWIQDDGEITLGPDGPIRIAGTNSDITERKQREEQIRLLMREVNHRSKNMLAVIQVIARQTAASGSKDFIKRFGERVQSLAVTQDLLVKNEWLGVDLEELISAQLMQFKGLVGTRIALKGKPLRISAASAQNLGLAIHELASNAGKFGALSNSKGRVAIAWQIKKASSKEEGERFAISWTERNGPPVLPPERRGFGSTVLGSMVKMGLSANVEIDYAKPGLEWHLECPAGNVVEKPRMHLASK
jgi:PAS domain S-box-containing protein